MPPSCHHLALSLASFAALEATATSTTATMSANPLSSFFPCPRADDFKSLWKSSDVMTLGPLCVIMFKSVAICGNCCVICQNLENFMLLTAFLLGYCLVTHRSIDNTLYILVYVKLPNTIRGRSKILESIWLRPQNCYLMITYTYKSVSYTDAIQILKN